MTNRKVELFFGFLIIILVIIFIFYTAMIVYKDSDNTYNIRASFNNIGPLVEGNKVVISGVTAGYVSNVNLSKKDYSVTVHMKIFKKIKISKDSKVMIKSMGILDPVSVIIVPSSNKKYLSNNELLINVSDWKSIEDKIGDIFLKVR